uniref:Caspase family p20 domain-containing protein n=1 Tax=Cyprinus carpio carpio TaxID=630221 RepID=A0A8C1D7A9_CYPCA
MTFRQTHKRMKNRALIVSVENFCSDADLNKRNGVKRDTRRLHKILTNLGFSVDIRTDINANQIYEAFKAESKTTVKDCFVGVISSHGEEGVVFGADGRAVKLAKIYSYFRGPSMADKSKFFLIQACRGRVLDGGAEMEADSSFSEEEDCMSELFSIPSDTAVMYATSPVTDASVPHSRTFNHFLRETVGRQKADAMFCDPLHQRGFPIHGQPAADDLSLTFTAAQLIDEPRRSRKSSIRTETD